MEVHGTHTKLERMSGPDPLFPKKYGYNFSRKPHRQDLPEARGTTLVLTVHPKDRHVVDIHCLMFCFWVSVLLGELSYFHDWDSAFLVLMQERWIHTPPHPLPPATNGAT